MRLEKTGSDGGPWPGVYVCVCVLKGGDGRLRIGSAGERRRGAVRVLLKFQQSFV